MAVLSWWKIQAGEQPCEGRGVRWSLMAACSSASCSDTLALSYKFPQAGEELPVSWWGVKAGIKEASQIASAEKIHTSLMLAFLCSCGVFAL